MDYTKGTWDSDGGIERLGWLAVALVIFSSWKPKRVIWGAYLFGMLSWLYFYIPDLTRRSMELFKMLPYAVTILVLVAVSLRRNAKSAARGTWAAIFPRRKISSESLTLCAIVQGRKRRRIWSVVRSAFAG
jgi:ABC-type uncharacterized transport system permease subunit